MKTLSLLLLCLTLGACALPGLKVAPRIGFYELSGDGNLASTPSLDDFDLEGVGAEDDQTVGARVELKSGALHLIGSIDVPNFIGDGTIESAIDDGLGNVIPAGANVDSDLEFLFANGLAAFDIIPGDTLDLSIGIGAAFLRLDQSFVDRNTNVEVQDEEDFLIPVVGGAASVHLGPVELGGTVSGLSLEFDDDDIFYLNVDVYGRFKLFGGSNRVRGSILAGFWWNRTDVSYEDDSIIVSTDLLITAPYVGFEVSL